MKAECAFPPFLAVLGALLPPPEAAGGIWHRCIVGVLLLTSNALTKNIKTLEVWLPCYSSGATTDP